MDRRSCSQKHTQATLLTLLTLLLLLPLALFAQVRESASYKIQFDSLNVGGGFATSSSYIIEDTTGEIATGPSESASYKLKAGYQQMDEVFLSLTAVSDVVMSPTLGGVTGGVSNGQTTATATTDGLAGYELQLKASTSPALQRDGGGSTIADYTPAGAVPDFVFSVAASDAELAYSPEGADIAQRFQDNGSACNTGSSDATDSCWDALTTTNTTVSQRTSSNHPSGTPTTIKFRVEIGSSASQLEGTYTATSTLTLIAL